MRKRRNAKIMGVIFSSVLFVMSLAAIANAQPPTNIPANLGDHAPVSFKNLAKVSPDGQYVVYVTSENLGMAEATIWVAKPDGSQRKAIVTSGDNFWVTNPIWSPQSDRIAYLKIVEVEQREYEVISRYELWVVNVDGTNDRLMADTPLLNPALSYGGQSDIKWNVQGEVEFYDNSVFPISVYALNVATGEIRKIGENVGTLGKALGDQPSNVPFFRQGYLDSSVSWSGDYMGNKTDNLPCIFDDKSSHPGKPKTIGYAGCAISSVAMVLSYFGRDVDPGRLNTYLHDINGYAGNCDVGQSWEIAGNYGNADGKVKFIPKSTDLNLLNTYLDKGYPVIACVKGSSDKPCSHFVVVTHKNNNGTYTINDPGSRNGKDKIIDKSEIQGLRIYTYEGSSGGSSSPTSEDYPTLQTFGDNMFLATTNANHEIYVWQKATSGKWMFLGNKGLTPTAVSMKPYHGRLYFAVKGTDKGVYIRSYDGNGQWSNWEWRGLTESPVMMQEYQGKLYVAIRGTDNGIYVGTYDGATWSGWNPWPAWKTLGATISSVSMQEYQNKLYLAVRGTDNGIYLRYYDGQTNAWSDWNTWSGRDTIGLTVSSITMKVYQDRLYLAVRGTNEEIFLRYYDGKSKTWSDWNTWSGTATLGLTRSRVSMKVYQDKLYLAVQGTDNKVYTRYYPSTNNSWSDWESSGEALSSVFMEEFNNRLSQAVMGNDNHVYTRYYPDPTTGKWTAWAIRDDVGAWVTSSGGSVMSFNGVASVTFPAGATAENLYVSIEEISKSATPAAPQGFNCLEANEFTAINASGTPITSFNRAVDVAFRYHPEELGGIKEQDITVQYYDELSKKWVALASIIDTTAHTVTAQSPHFTKFGMFAPISVEKGSFLRENWQDTDKSLNNPDDDWLCWAAAAANILGTTNWNVPLFDSTQAIFMNFQSYWTNAGGLMSNGWHWFFDGTEPEDRPGWAQVDVAGGGNYLPDYNFFDYYSEAWATYDASLNSWSNGANLLPTLDEYLHDDYGVAAAIYSSNGGHALSIWGYEYNEFGDYTGLWVTDSDDYMIGLKLLDISLDLDKGLWYLDSTNTYGYSGWWLSGLQALAVKPTDPQPAVPEPTMFVLFALGLLGLCALRRKRT